MNYSTLVIEKKRISDDYIESPTIERAERPCFPEFIAHFMR